MLKIGITGGIGTGKSYMASKFAAMHFPVYFADNEARKLYQREEVKSAVFRELGEGPFSDKEIDFRKLSKIIFNDKDKQEKINHIIHPLIREDFKRWAAQQKCSVLFMEAALIYEAGFENDFDFVIVVDSPEELRVKRLLKRDGLSEEEIAKRIKMQMPQEEKIRRADLLILNENGEEITFRKSTEI